MIAALKIGWLIVKSVLRPKGDTIESHLKKKKEKKKEIKES